MTQQHSQLKSLIEEALALKESEPEACITLAQKAAELARKENLLEELAQSLFGIGVAEFRLSNFQKSALALSEALDLLEQIQIKHELLFHVLFWLGRAHDRIGNYSLALEIHLKALDNLEGKGDSKELAQVHSQIGAVHLHLNNFEKAIDCYFKALDIYDKQGNTKALSSIYNNLGVIFRKNSNYDDALTYLKKSLALAESQNEPIAIAYPLYHIGNVQKLKGNLKEAEACFLRGLRLLEGTTDKYIICSHLSGLADVLYEFGNLKKAIFYHQKALKLGEESSSKEIIYEAHEGLYHCYKKQTNFAKALHHHECFLKVREEVFSEQSDKRIRMLQFEYDYKAAEQEAEIYRLKNIELVKANELKNEFLSIAAHDLKSPLQTIMGFAELIREKPDRAELVARQAESIFNASKRMLKLVDDLLKTAAMESGRLELKKTLTDVAELLRFVVEEQRYYASKKDLEIHFEMEGDCTANVDAARLYDVFENLVSNAIKYSPKGKAIVASARLAQTSNPPNLQTEVLISIKDEGLGMTEDDIRNAFGKFQKLSSQPTGGETSTGLGLSIVKELVSLHGGKVWIESEGKNKGTTFFVSLPTSNQLSMQAK
ncbi:MAG: tetratricopeptide repeat-containing sensor histidine kinase [Chloroherpetonaceae bacterium]